MVPILLMFLGTIAGGFALPLQLATPNTTNPDAQIPIHIDIKNGSLTITIDLSEDQTILNGVVIFVYPTFFNSTIIRQSDNNTGIVGIGFNSFGGKQNVNLTSAMLTITAITLNSSNDESNGSNILNYNQEDASNLTSDEPLTIKTNL